MRKLILAAALALSACNQGSVSTISTVAVVSADQAYIAYVQRLTTQVQSGTITRDDFHTKETQAYSALLLVRAGQMTTTAFTQSLGN